MPPSAIPSGLRGPSRTALLAAVGRALHREGPPPHVLDDWLAADLAGPDGQVIADGLRSITSPERLRAFAAWTAARSRFVEDFVLSAAGDGITQYISLGAGLDSFVYRHPGVADRLTVFEVDHPLSQEWKCRRLDELGVAEPVNLVRVAADLATQSLDHALTDAGVRHDLRSVVSWIGVTMYLERTAIEQTLASLARLAHGSLLVLSIDQPPEVLDDAGRVLLDEVRGAAASMGEPFVSLLRREEMEDILGRNGFRDVAHFGAPDAVRHYFAGSDVRIPDVQRLVSATVA